MKKRSSVAGVLLAFLIVLVVFALIGGGCAVSGYNKAIRFDENVKTAWAQVENVLQRRYDLIPNIVETVKGYAEHEQEIFTDIAKSREKYFQAGDRGARMEASAGLERALSRLLVLQERYPDLKAQQQFQALIVELEGSENRIAVERKRYNDAVRALNAYQRSVFGRIYCGWAGVEAAEYFEVAAEAKEAPKVKFTDD
ncbi:MAG: LemA family protein [Phycisphaerae bacterium]